jgi:hypothetical protein
VRASPFSARAPACDTPANLPAASCALRRRAINPDANLRAAVERVVISRTTIEIELAENAAEDNQNRILIIPWTPPSPYLRRQIIQGESDQSSTARPMRTKARARLIDALRDAHRWRHELTTTSDQTIEALAVRGSKIERSIRMTLSLAFLSPTLVNSAIDGRLSRGFGAKRLMDLPMAWSSQWPALGLKAPCICQHRVVGLRSAARRRMGALRLLGFRSPLLSMAPHPSIPISRTVAGAASRARMCKASPTPNSSG